MEEWTFLPANWDNELLNRPIFDKNFVLLEFDPLDNFSTETGDILIMNLVTRTKFWIRSGTLRTQVKEKAAGRIDFEDIMAQGYTVNAYASQMNVEKDRIVITYKILGYRPDILVLLGWFSNPYIYISKYVN